MGNERNWTNQALDPRQFDFFACLALAAAAIILYIPALGADFVYDSRLYVLGNDYAHHLGNLWDVVTFRVMHLDVIDCNRPVYLASVMLDWAFWGANPAGHHLCSIMLHAVVAALLFKACRALLPDASPWVPLAAALLFVAHPLNCESVSEISYRNDLMVAAFLLAALNLAIVFQPVYSFRNLLLGLAILACAFLAVGSKENGVAGPPLLICYWLLYRRNEPRAGWIALSAAATVVVVTFLIARFSLQPQQSLIFAEPAVRPGNGTLEGLAFIQPRVWAFYLRQIVWPRNLCAEYDLFSVRNFGAVTSMLAVIGLVGVQAFVAFRNRALAIGAALFWCALLPASNIVPIYRPIADRFMYVPMAGVAIMLAALPWPRGILNPLSKKLAPSAITAIALALIVACALAWVTVWREQAWHDNVTIWTDAVSKNPPSVYARVNLAGALLDAGKAWESIPVFESAIRMTGGASAEPIAGMAIALDTIGHAREADATFKKAASLDELYAYPDLLLKGLMWEQADAAKLEVIVDRNRNGISTPNQIGKQARQ